MWHWILKSDDKQRASFVIIDKKSAVLYVIAGNGRLRGRSLCCWVPRLVTTAATCMRGVPTKNGGDG